MIKHIIQYLAFIVVTLLLFTYLPCNIYSFQPPKKFTGNYLFNPYKYDSCFSWQQSNFHAHSIAWKGVTNGKEKAAYIIKEYKSKGYAYASISDYEKVSAADKAPCSVNVYEHGYNISKVHQLVLMPQHICYEDFPLFQFTSAKQTTISKLDEYSKAIVLAHPKLRHGYKDIDLKKLTGYNLMEVLNHSVNSSKKWDIALSAGKPVWIIGDDDSHDVNDLHQTFVNWTMIDCAQHNKDSLIQHLIDGDAYGVVGKNAENNNKLVSVVIKGALINVKVQSKADSIQFIGQGGLVKDVHFNTNTATYVFKKEDSYIRTVIYTKTSAMYLNPVIRYNGIDQPVNLITAHVNLLETTLYKGLLISMWTLSLRYLNIIAVKKTAGVFQKRFYHNKNTRFNI